MKFKEKIEDHIAVLNLRGALLCEPDATSLRDRIHDYVRREITHVVIDMGGVTYINSCGLGLLVSLLTSLRRAGGDLRLVGLGANVTNLFVVTQLTKVFETYETVKDAMKGFGVPAA